MHGNMSYTITMSFEDIDTIKALKRYNGMNAKTLIHEALNAYMKENNIEISMDEDTVWVWSMDKPKAGFMSRSDEKWHEAYGPEDDFTFESDYYF